MPFSLTLQRIQNKLKKKYCYFIRRQFTTESTKNTFALLGFCFPLTNRFMVLRWQIANSEIANITAKIRAELITGHSEAIHFIVDSGVGRLRGFFAVISE